MIPTAGTVVLGDAAEPDAAIDEAVVAVEAYSVNPGETFLLEAPPVGVAAALPPAGLTALRLNRIIGSLAGKRVLLTGASGGVGHYFTGWRRHRAPR
jgi:NADPH:quinone reductase-like Zn-dependent oxidoreductase